MLAREISDSSAQGPVVSDVVDDEVSSALAAVELEDSPAVLDTVVSDSVVSVEVCGSVLAVPVGPVCVDGVVVGDPVVGVPDDDEPPSVSAPVSSLGQPVTPATTELRARKRCIRPRMRLILPC